MCKQREFFYVISVSHHRETHLFLTFVPFQQCILRRSFSYQAQLWMIGFAGLPDGSLVLADEPPVAVSTG